MRKKGIQIIAGAVVIALCFGAGVAWGRNGQKEYPLNNSKVTSGNAKIETEALGKQNEDNKNIEVSTRRVAVVNLDTGIVQNGQSINYASSLVRFPTDEFIYTSLEEARTGITLGQYAAYVVIPASFSENIQSINTTMTKSNITYEMNQNLQEEDRVSTLKQLNTFIQGMSDNVSILFVSGILKEFHTAQDNVLTVMKNDNKDTEAILQIKPHDLEKNVPFIELLQPELDHSVLDIQKYITHNGELLEDIRGQYEMGIAKGEEDRKSLMEKGDSVNASLSTTNDTVKNLDIGTDQEGNKVYDSELNTVKSTLTNYNTVLDSNRNNIQQNVDEAEVDLATIKSYWNGIVYGVSQYQGAREGTINSLASSISGGSFETTKTTPAYTAEESGLVNIAGTEYQLIDAINGKLDVDVLTAFITDYTNKITCTSTYEIQTGDMDISIKDEGAVKLWLNNSLPLCDPGRFVESTGGTYSESDTAINQENAANAFSNAEAKLAFDMGVEGEYQISSMTEEEIGEVMTAVDKDVVSPLLNRTSEIKDTFKQHYAASSSGLIEFQNQLTSYNPLRHVEQNQIEASYAGMQDNASGMHKDIQDREQKQSESLFKTYQTYGENQMKLQESVQAAAKESNEAVTAGLANAKSIKEESNEINQNLLQGFSKKLQYTRVGTIENIVANQYIVSPIVQSEQNTQVTEKKNEERKEQQEQTTSAGAVADYAAGQSEQKDTQRTFIRIGILAATIILGVAGVLAVLKKKKESDLNDIN